MSSIDRRTFLLSVSAAALAPRTMASGAFGAGARTAQAGTPPMRVRGLNHMTLAVSDPKRSLEFYQGLFGMPVQARQGPTVLLSIGSGPQFLALSQAGNAAPSINHFCLSVEAFAAFGAMRIFERPGLSLAEGPAAG